MTLIDHMRAQGPETWRLIRYGGFDPDLTTSGIGRVLVEVSDRGRRRLKRIEARTLRRIGKARDEKAAQGMIEVLHAHQVVFACDEATVESQQAYPDPKAARSEIIAKANDLIYLGHVTGAAVWAYLRVKAEPEVLLPRQWKGNRTKEAMHAEILELAAREGCETRIDGLDQPLTAADKHAMDAVGMALRRAGWKV